MLGALGKRPGAAPTRRRGAVSAVAAAAAPHRRHPSAPSADADADADDAAAAPPQPVDSSIPPPRVWRRELARLAPLLRDPTRPWALPLALRLCYERNDAEARRVHLSGGGAGAGGRGGAAAGAAGGLSPAQWASDVLGRRAQAERALAAAAHAARAAHARVGLLRELVGLAGRRGGGGRGRGHRRAGGDGDKEEEEEEEDDDDDVGSFGDSNDNLLPRRWLTAQEADKERTTLSEARKAADRAAKAVRAAAAAAAAWGDADFSARRAPRMAALAGGLAAHTAWLQRTALREVLAAGRRNAAEVGGGGGGLVVAAAAPMAAASDEDNGGDESDKGDQRRRASSSNSPPFPRVAGLAAAYRAVAVACFDCYSDPELERRPPAPGLPLSAGRRFPRLVPQQALFPVGSAGGGGVAGGVPLSSALESGESDDHAPARRRRLAAARRLLAAVDEAEGDGARATMTEPLFSLAEVDEGLAEESYGAEPLPPMAVLLERAVALERRRQAAAAAAAAAARRGAGAGGGGGSETGRPLPLPMPRSTSTTTTTTRRRRPGASEWRAWDSQYSDGGARQRR
jgi:hypothetical protein